jgi:hypothetical protein
MSVMPVRKAPISVGVLLLSFDDICNIGKSVLFSMYLHCDEKGNSRND